MCVPGLTPTRGDTTCCRWLVRGNVVTPLGTSSETWAGCMCVPGLTPTRDYMLSVACQGKCSDPPWNFFGNLGRIHVCTRPDPHKGGHYMLSVACQGKCSDPPWNFFGNLGRMHVCTRPDPHKGLHVVGGLSGEM